MNAACLGPLREIATTLAVLALAAGCGRWAIRREDLEDGVARATLAALFGLMALSAAVGALLVTGTLNTPWGPVVLGGWAALGACGWIRPRGSSSAAAAAPPASGPDGSAPRLARWTRVAIGVSVAIAAVGACAPATGWDATYCHFAMPSYWVRHGGMPDRFDWPFYYYPLNLHMLYAAGFIAGGTTSAALYGAVCFAASAVLVWRWAAWAGGPAAGPAAALLLLACVAFGVEADSGNVEPGLLAFGTAAMLLLARARAAASARMLVLAAVATGFAVGIKMTALVLGVAWLALAIAPGPFARCRVVAGIAVAALVGAPWYLRAALATGNPFYPAFSDAFPAPYVMLPTGPELMRHPLHFLGRAGAHFARGYPGVVLALIPCVAPRALGRTRLPAAGLLVALTVAGTALTMPWGGEHLARFASLAFAPVLVAGGVAWAGGGSARPFLFRAGLAVAAACVLAAQGGLAYRLALKLPVIAGAQTRADFLGERMNTYPLLERLNAMADPPGRPIRVLLTDGRSLYLDQEFVYGADHHGYVDYERLENGAAFHRRLRELGVTHLVLNRHRDAHTMTLINRHRMDPTFLDAAHFRPLASWAGASHEAFAPAELYEFVP